MCEFAGEHGHRVFLLGAAAEVNREACARLRKDFGIQTEGYSPPNRPFPFPRAEDEEILARLREFRPQIVVVCFGSPKQELWADLHNETLDRMGVRWVIGAGGTLDFIAGAVKRAPVLLQKAGLESVWRLVLEPRSRIRRVLRAFQFFRYI